MGGCLSGLGFSDQAHPHTCFTSTLQDTRQGGGVLGAEEMPAKEKYEQALVIKNLKVFQPPLLGRLIISIDI